MCGAVGSCFGPTSFHIWALFQSLSGVAVVTFLYVLDCPPLYCLLMFRLCCAMAPCLHWTYFFWSKCNSMQSVFSVKINKKSILDKEYSSLQRQQFKLELITNRGAFFWVISQLSCCSGILSLGDCAVEPSPREECSLCQASTWSEVRCVGFVCLFFRNAFCANTDLVTEPRWKRLSIKIELNQIASSEVQNCQNHCWLYWLFVVWG